MSSRHWLRDQKSILHSAGTQEGLFLPHTWAWSSIAQNPAHCTEAIRVLRVHRCPPLKLTSISVHSPFRNSSMARGRHAQAGPCLSTWSCWYGLSLCLCTPWGASLEHCLLGLSPSYWEGKCFRCTLGLISHTPCLPKIIPELSSRSNSEHLWVCPPKKNASPKYEKHTLWERHKLAC